MGSIVRRPAATARPAPPAGAACERCGAPRGAGLTPWCDGCLAALDGAPPGSPARAEYRRDYQRAYQRARRGARGPARARWVAELGGREVRVALRRRGGRVTLTGAGAALDAAVRLAAELGLGSPSVSTSGGGRGSRAQARFRVVAPLGEAGEAGLTAALARRGARSVGRFEG